MAAVTFDTLKFVEKLKAAGVPDAQAKAMSEAFRDAQGELEIATKRDLKELELKIETRLEGLRGELGGLRGELGGLRGELTLIKWMLGLLLGGVFALILKTFLPV